MNSAYPPLDLHRLNDQLADSPIGHTILYHTSIPSTMPVAAQAAQDQATRSGTLVVAEEQTSGRGRRGRRWQTPYASSLLVSVIFKPPDCQLPGNALTMLAGITLLSAVADHLPELQGALWLKWPNDLVIGNDAARAAKVAGILAESALNSDSALRHAILGIGVNVNQERNELPRIAPPTPPPTSLRLAARRVRGDELLQPEGAARALDLVDRTGLLIELCHQIAKVQSLPGNAIHQRWKNHLNTLGHQVTIYASGVEEAPSFSGHAVDVQEDGAMLVIDASGALHAVHAGDVSVRVKV